MRLRTNSGAVFSRSSLVALFACIIELHLCCQCVHYLLLEWNFSFRNAGEKNSQLSP